MSAAASAEAALIAAVEARTLPLAAFTHAEHVRLGWAYLARSSLLEALAAFRAALVGFATHHGKATLYHETVTFAYLLLIHERMARRPGASWPEFVAANADLLRWRDGPLFRLYPATLLDDPVARRQFVLPPGDARS